MLSFCFLFSFFSSFPSLLLCSDQMLKAQKEADLRAILGDSYDPPVVTGACANQSQTLHVEAPCTIPSESKVTASKDICDTANSKPSCSGARQKQTTQNVRRKTYTVSPAGFKTYPNTPNVDTGATDISGRVRGSSRESNRRVHKVAPPISKAIASGKNSKGNRQQQQHILTLQIIALVANFIYAAWFFTGW